MSGLLDRIKVSRDDVMETSAAFRKAQESTIRRNLAQHLDDLNYNMLVRMRLSGEKRIEAAKVLRGMTHGDTYPAARFEHAEALRRTHEYFAELLKLSELDRTLLMEEHGFSLDRVAPIRSDHYAWGPKLFGKDAQPDVRYAWRRVDRTHSPLLSVN